MNDQSVTIGNADVVDRLVRLRAVLPLMANDLATARRRASALEVENQRLTRRVRELESRRTAGRLPSTRSSVASLGRAVRAQSAR